VFEFLEEGLKNLARLGAAIIGFFLYLLFGLIGLGLRTILFALGAAIVIPIVSIISGLIAANVSNLFVGLTTPFLIGATLAAAAAVFIPLDAIISALRIVVTFPLRGVVIGWEDGFSNLFESPSSREARLNPVADILNPNTQQNFSNEMYSMMMSALSGEVTVDEMIERVGEMAVRAARRPMTEEEFARLELSTDEYQQLIAEQQSALSEQEMALLQNADGLTKQNLESYKNLQRLKNDNCPILQGRPEIADTVVLMKQYKRNGEWLPVPGVSHIFDRDTLKGAMLVDGLHPTQEGARSLNQDEPVRRDKLINPVKYTIGADEYETRYRLHNYYPSDHAERGVNQEENQLLKQLRNDLLQLQRSSGSLPAVAANEDHDNSHSTEQALSPSM
jgi:hypothetical protein